MAQILDGRVVAKESLMALKVRIARLSRPPGLAVIKVGEDPASAIYVRRKTRRAERLGFYQPDDLHFPEDTTQASLLNCIAALNADDKVDGILVQLPLPSHISERAVLTAVSPDKDVDGFHALNVGRLAQGLRSDNLMIPCTPKGAMRLLEESGVNLSGAEAVVVGRSNIVGRPMAWLLEQKNATVTLCHSRTENLQGHIKRADIVVAAVGRSEMIKGSWIRPGAVVIDVGINRREDGTLCGDVDFNVAVKRASAITPVPGGVGPMTIAMLMENTVIAAESHQRR
jgi:methylenetetrahydrofolate dehydrogenase (NADP+)/methenyltetrahydrofolate cyclohydrolase